MRLLLFLMFNFWAIAHSYGQAKEIESNPAPYQKNKNLPSFSIRLLDSTTIFNTKSIQKGKPTVFILFSPDCNHCAQLAREIKADVLQFDQVNFFMVSPPMPLYDIKMFAHINGLVDKKQITVGQDIDFFFGSFYRAETVPFVVIYDAEKKLFTTLKSIKKLEELFIELNKLKDYK